MALPRSRCRRLLGEELQPSQVQDCFFSETSLGRKSFVEILGRHPYLPGFPFDGLLLHLDILQFDACVRVGLIPEGGQNLFGLPNEDLID